MIYEQDSGELDEDELYQSRYNRNIFFEEVMAPSGYFGSGYPLDLSGSMCTGDKISHANCDLFCVGLGFQQVSERGILLDMGIAVEMRASRLFVSTIGARKLQLGKLFSQQALNANADGYAMLYCFDKFKSDAKINCSS